jgi:hypothetical protein
MIVQFSLGKYSTGAQGNVDPMATPSCLHRIRRVHSLRLSF